MTKSAVRTGVTIYAVLIPILVLVIVVVIFIIAQLQTLPLENMSSRSYDNQYQYSSRRSRTTGSHGYRAVGEF